MKELSLLVINRYNDRGSINSVMSEEIGIDAESIEIGKTLPQWRWKGCGEKDPAVRYYDGEYLELDFRDRVFGARVDGGPVELLEACCPENIYVHETRVVAVRLNGTGMPESFPCWHEMYRKGSFNAITMRFFASPV